MTTDTDATLGPYLSPAEHSRIMLAALLTSPTGNQTEDDLRQIFEWAENAMQEAALIRGVLDGRIAVSVRDGELGFSPLTDADRAEIERRANP